MRADGFARQVRVTLQRLDPVAVAFLGSLFLSVLATLTAVTVGKDAALYLDTALTFTESGWQAAYQQFNWPWFSILLGLLHQLTHIPLEPLAYGICALFMAGTCALLVKLIDAKVAGLGWWACVVVLAIPAFNDFRGQILREFGYWFFCILALVLSMTWAERGGWLRAGAVYVAILLAAAFRFEALFLGVAVSVWQLLGIRSWSNARRALQLLIYPLAGLLCLGLFYILADEINISRVKSFLLLLRPDAALTEFQKLSSQFAESMTYRYSRDEAGQIVFFGIIATLLLEFLKSLGPLAIPFFTRRLSTTLGHGWKQFTPFGWAYFFYFIVLMLFFWRMQFVNGRYASMLAWLAVPFVVVLLMEIAQRRPRLGKLLIALTILSMFGNVISLSAKKTHYKEAAQWVESNVDPAVRVYFQDSRISYYAGRRVPRYTYPPQTAITQAANQFDFFVLEFAADDPVLKDFLSKKSMRVLASFENRDGDVVTIFARPSLSGGGK